MDRVDCIVVGAGVVGLAIARQLAQAGREVLVLEANESFGMETSARNSEVIHAGIYYPQGSLMARLCVEGRGKLYDYAQTRGLAHRAKLDGNDALAHFSHTLEKVCVDTVEAGAMTKDLAILVGPDQGWLTTEAFLDKISTNLKAALAKG